MGEMESQRTRGPGRGLCFAMNDATNITYSCDTTSYSSAVLGAENRVATQSDRHVRHKGLVVDLPMPVEGLVSRLVRII